MITLQSIIKRETKNIIEVFLLDNNLVDVDEVGAPIGFIGGSQRFKFSNTNSDLDLFYYSSKDRGKIANILMSNFFYEVDNYQDPHTKNGGVSFGWQNKQLNVHLILITDLECFRNLREEHIKVCDFLNDYPHIREFIKLLKMNDLSTKGRFIYRSLLKMI